MPNDVIINMCNEMSVTELQAFITTSKINIIYVITFCERKG